MWSLGGGRARRGYNTLIFDGPGQGAALFRRAAFRPDWEQVITPVVDLLCAAPTSTHADRDPGHQSGRLLGARARRLRAPHRRRFADPGVVECLDVAGSQPPAGAAWRCCDAGDKRGFDERWPQGMRRRRRDTAVRTA